VISGALPKWQQYFHTAAFALMCALFAGFGLFGGRFLLRSADWQFTGLLVSSLVFIAIAVLSIGLQVWFWRRIVSEFTYDGRALRFRTLGNAEMQTRDLSEIADLNVWRGRGGPLGYRLHFRDGGKIYLQYAVSNCVAVAEHLRRALGLER
jgi:hypothetical protein